VWRGRAEKGQFFKPVLLILDLTPQLWWPCSGFPPIPGQRKSLNVVSHFTSLGAAQNHSWASALELDHPVSQSGTGAFRYRIGSLYSGTGLVPASAFLLVQVPD